MTEMELWNKYKQLKGTYTHIKLKNGNVIKGLSGRFYPSHR